MTAVFVSYSHDSAEHSYRVLQFAEALRSHGIEASIDADVVRPPHGPVDPWLASRSRMVERIDQTMTDFKAAQSVDLAMLTVASRQLRALVES